MRKLRSSVSEIDAGSRAQSDAAASDEERPEGRMLVESGEERETSSSSEDERGMASPPPNKCRKYNKHVNIQKSVIKPTQQLEYLGILWDTQKSTMALPSGKVLKIKKTIDKTLSQGQASLREIQCLLGLLILANLTTPRGRLHCRRIQRFLRNFPHRRARQKRQLPHPVLQELSWWRKAIDHSTVALHKTEVTHFLTTDAADAGWGAQLNNQYLSGTWTRYQSHWHSNIKELFAVYGAIKSQQKDLRHAHILVQSDNRTLVAYIRNEGGTRSLSLLELTTKLELSEQLNILLSAAYLPGRYNGIADRLSRNKPVPEWHLLPPASEAVFRIWGIPEIDLFASKRSAVVRNYVSWDATDGSASYCDAFSRHWKYGLAWAEQLNILLSAAYLPGRYNGIADRLSRNKPVPEWHLLPPASEAVFRIWGIPEIDLFASKRSAVVRNYVSWDATDGSASYCDAFSRHWKYGLAWVFPPPNLIPRVLCHLNTAEGIYIIIAPYWSQCYWLADLRARAQAEPVRIQNLRTNLIDLTTSNCPPQVDLLELF